MKNSVFVIVLLVSALGFSQDSEIFIKSKLPVVKTVYSSSIDALFFSNFNKNEIHVNTFNNTYSTILNGLGFTVLDFDVSLNGKYAVTTNQDNSIIIWQVKPKEMLHKFNPDQELLQCIYFYDNNTFFSLGKNGKLKKWDIKGKLLYELNVSSSTLKAISSFDTKIIIGGHDKTLRQINDKTKKIEQETYIGETITCVLPNKKQKRIYVGDSKGKLHVLDLNFKIINTIDLHKSIITDIHQINNEYLVTSSWDKTIKLIRINDYEVKKTFYGHKDYIFSLTSRNTDLFSSSRDKKILKWNLEKFIE